MPGNEVSSDHLRAGDLTQQSREPAGDGEALYDFPRKLVQRTDRGYRIPKIIWGTNLVDLHNEVKSSLTITGRRLDAESGPLVDWDTNTAYVDPANKTGLGGTQTPFAEVDKGAFAITSSFIVPALGCWEVTGHFHGEDLKVVIDVK